MIQINKFLVVGGDLRNVELAKLLKEDGKTVYTYGMNINSSEPLEKILEDVEVVIGPISFSRDGLTVNSTFVESQILIKDLLGKIKEKTLCDKTLYIVHLFIQTKKRWYKCKRYIQ